MALSHIERSINKFGLTEDYEIMNDDVENVKPFYHHETNLDDLENVAGFNQMGKKDSLYVFKLDSKGMYTREELPKSLDFKPVAPNTRMNIMMNKKENFRLIKSEHPWLLDLDIRNDTVVYDGDSSILHRIHNRGSMLGNFVPASEIYKETVILTKMRNEYYIAAKPKIENKRGAMKFAAKFNDDIKILQNPPENSIFFLSGMLLNEKPKEDIIIEGVTIKIKEIKNPKKFYIRIKKTKDNFTIRSIPDEIELNISGNVSFENFVIYQDIFHINRILFTTEDIVDADLQHFV